MTLNHDHDPELSLPLIEGLSGDAREHAAQNDQPERNESENDRPARLDGLNTESVKEI